MRIWIFLFLLCPITSFALCVSTSKANLRSGPGPKNKITWTVPKYTPLLRMDKQGSWYKVQDQDGDIHWVYSKNVNTKWKCVSIKTASARLRTGPSAEHSIADIWQVDRYTPFRRIDISDNGWYQVEAPWGGTYWISKNLVWLPMRVRGISY